MPVWLTLSYDRGGADNRTRRQPLNVRSVMDHTLSFLYNHSCSGQLMKQNRRTLIALNQRADSLPKDLHIEVIMAADLAQPLTASQLDALAEASKVLLNLYTLSVGYILSWC